MKVYEGTVALYQIVRINTHSDLLCLFSIFCILNFIFSRGVSLLWKNKKQRQNNRSNCKREAFQKFQTIKTLPSLINKTGRHM